MLFRKKGERAMEEAEKMEAMARACMEKGRAYDLKESPAQAELQYRRALKLYEQLHSMTGSSDFADALREVCLSLADLCMQQGNLHGADVYYVSAMDCGLHSEHSTHFLG